MLGVRPQTGAVLHEIFLTGHSPLLAPNLDSRARYPKARLASHFLLDTKERVFLPQETNRRRKPAFCADTEPAVCSDYLKYEESAEVQTAEYSSLQDLGSAMLLWGTPPLWATEERSAEQVVEYQKAAKSFVEKVKA
jgi:hypothetical protein